MSSHVFSLRKAVDVGQGGDHVPDVGMDTDGGLKQVRAGYRNQAHTEVGETSNEPVIMLAEGRREFPCPVSDPVQYVVDGHAMMVRTSNGVPQIGPPGRLQCECRSGASGHVSFELAVDLLDPVFGCKLE